MGITKKLAFEACENGKINELIDALPQQVRQVDFAEEYGEILDFIQHYATTKAAGKSIDDLGAEEQNWLDEQTIKIAKLLASINESDETTVVDPQEASKAPSQANLDEANALLLAPVYSAASDPNAFIWPTLTDLERAEWEARAATVISAYTIYHQANIPEYPLADGQIVFAGKECEEESAVAYTENDGKCYISMHLVEAMEKNLTFVTSTIIHELYGHPTFDRGYQVGTFIYEQGKANKEGKDIDDVILNDNESERFQYYESEIGALIYEYGYYVATDEKKQVNTAGDPNRMMPSLLHDMSQQWAPTVLAPLLKGLYERFKADVNLKPGAADWFRSIVKAKLGIKL